VTGQLSQLAQRLQIATAACVPSSPFRFNFFSELTIYSSARTPRLRIRLTRMHNQAGPAHVLDRLLGATTVMETSCRHTLERLHHNQGHPLLHLTTAIKKTTPSFLVLVRLQLLFLSSFS
jgi:hypothetical protein